MKETKWDKLNKEFDDALDSEFGKAKLAPRKYLLENKEKVSNDLDEMRIKSNQNKMKQTAVEWFKDVIESFGNKHELQMSWDTFDEVFKQAKEIEKEQRQEDTNHGYSQGWDDGSQNLEPMRPEVKSYTYDEMRTIAYNAYCLAQLEEPTEGKYNLWIQQFKKKQDK